jgi:hypothetical protein
MAFSSSVWEGNDQFNGVNCDPQRRWTASARIIGTMALPPRIPSRQRDPNANDLLIKGIVVALIGLAVLLAPYFSQSPELQALLANSSLVGWFALVLGGAFIVQHILRRRSGK